MRQASCLFKIKHLGNLIPVSNLEGVLIGPTLVILPVLSGCLKFLTGEYPSAVLEGSNSGVGGLITVGLSYKDVALVIGAEDVGVLRNKRQELISGGVALALLFGLGLGLIIGAVLRVVGLVCCLFGKPCLVCGLFGIVLGLFDGSCLILAVALRFKFCILATFVLPALFVNTDVSIILVMVNTSK